MIQELPLESEPTDYRFSTTLGDTDYTFRVYYNKRDGFWYFSIFNLAKIPIRQGIRITLDSFHLLDKGALVVIEAGNSGTEAGRNDLGARVQIIYYES